VSQPRSRCAITPWTWSFWITLFPSARPFSPDNAIEQVWGALKSKELANLCPDTLDEAADVAGQGLDRIGSDAELCLAFLRHCGLRL
jgi:transposase